MKKFLCVTFIAFLALVCMMNFLSGAVLDEKKYAEAKKKQQEQEQQKNNNNNGAVERVVAPSFKTPQQYLELAQGFQQSTVAFVTSPSFIPDVTKYITQDLLVDIKNFLAPEPLSPLFKKGGQFEGWNEDLTMTVLVMLLLAVIDIAIVRPFLHPDARYYALHAVANTIATINAAPEVYRALFVDPMTSFSGPSSTMWANSAIAAIHLYHCVAFKLSAADIFHHVTFVIILCGLAIPYKHVGGVANNFGCFFLSGIPGGMDYVLLVLVKQGKMAKLTEKRYNCLINQWLRGPSMTVYATLGWVNWIMGSTRQVPHLMIFIVVALHFYNGQYYAREVFQSYAVHKERDRVSRAQILAENGETKKTK